MILFYGCRHPEKDYIYQDELENYVTDGVLSQLHTAFSRQHEKKVYVQVWFWLPFHMWVTGQAQNQARTPLKLCILCRIFEKLSVQHGALVLLRFSLIHINIIINWIKAWRPLSFPFFMSFSNIHTLTHVCCESVIISPNELFFLILNILEIIEPIREVSYA